MMHGDIMIQTLPPHATGGVTVMLAQRLLVDDSFRLVMLDILEWRVAALKRYSPNTVDRLVRAKLDGCKPELSSIEKQVIYHYAVGDIDEC